MTPLGERVRSLRTTLGIGQAEFARALGRAPQDVHKWEKGINQVPSAEVPAIAAKLGVRICELYGVEEDHPTPAFHPSHVDRFTSDVVQAWPGFSEDDQELLEVLARALATYRAGREADEPA